MRTNLKAILSAVGVAVMLASPAMAKTVRHQHAATSTVYIPSDARGSVVPHGAIEGGPYTPSGPSPLHGLSPDFQGGGATRVDLRRVYSPGGALRPAIIF
jgi:hypothetical protein